MWAWHADLGFPGITREQAREDRQFLAPCILLRKRSPSGAHHAFPSRRAASGASFGLEIGTCGGFSVESGAHSHPAPRREGSGVHRHHLPLGDARMRWQGGAKAARPANASVPGFGVRRVRTTAQRADLLCRSALGTLQVLCLPCASTLPRTERSCSPWSVNPEPMVYEVTARGSSLSMRSQSGFSPGLKLHRVLVAALACHRQCSHHCRTERGLQGPRHRLSRAGPRHNKSASPNLSTGWWRRSSSFWCRGREIPLAA